MAGLVEAAPLLPIRQTRLASRLPSRDSQHMTDDEVFDRDYWEQRYAAAGLTWSGAPNAVLVTETSALTPGRALDIGSGEGGDAIWLASRGWTVTGVDISQNALDKAAARAASVGAEVSWEQHDLSEWMPPPASFDLVTSHFMHLPAALRRPLFGALAAAVAPGGTLLIVGHDLSGDHEHHSELMFSVDDVLADIDSAGLQVEVAESRSRPSTSAQGEPRSVSDVVVRATK